LEAFLAGDERAAMVVGPWHQGFVHGDDSFALITEQELFGARIEQRSKSRERERGVNPELLIRNLAELRVGQPVVHVNHGVGRYLGLEKLAAGGIEAEFMALEYAGSSKLYVPVASLHLISRYSGDSDQPPLHKLGSETWAKARAKAAEQVRDVAAELLEIYARRAAKPGFAFAIDESAYTAFAADFRYVETADQAAAIGAVLRDMSLPVAMDRLVCGDVGFGKTEVAMRAAFIAVHNQKQVAVLVPTTLLAQQHFENFRDRFANQPVRIEVMSRFRSAAEQKKVLEDLVAGKVDIVIGTHKLLQKEVKFADLGLLIVDEEHRFGVRQKEQIKALRADVDILTLTATPIPRTLNMAIGGMRDLSIIATPPARRLAVRTFVRQWDGPTIREAVMRELLRGGQVFYLHNEVETIANELEKLQKIVPEARMRVAHGQMGERDLEAVMSDFYHQRFNVLLCSTIIETGIDIPSANTIIINRADHLGLAQLHQLRGRVGRSHHQAYAYLMTPPPKLLTPDATKRLEAVAQLQDLGAGFALATHDLEIRGAGELLGDDQSGQINAIGFSLYMEMLEEAVKALREGRQIDNDTLLADATELELRIPALLPDDYIPDVNLRLSLYKRIAGCDDEAGLDELKVEMIDRFGLLPEQAKNLFAIARLRQLAEAIGVRRIDAGPQGVSLEFRSSTAVDPTAIIRLIQSRPSDYKLEGASKLRLFRANHNASERLAAVDGLLTALGAPAAATALSAQGVCA
ncbi:MAG: transcription-repair coupling factor, partial [Corallincola sp.]|nr:transcription-repair coupling factor [Corallincola sp.]